MAETRTDFERLFHSDHPPRDAYRSRLFGLFLEEVVRHWCANESSAPDTRVARVRDLVDRVTVDGREEHAVAIWRTASDIGANRSDSVSGWLRR